MANAKSVQNLAKNLQVIYEYLETHGNEVGELQAKLGEILLVKILENVFKKLREQTSNLNDNATINTEYLASLITQR